MTHILKCETSLVDANEQQLGTYGACPRWAGGLLQRPRRAHPSLLVIGLALGVLAVGVLTLSVSNAAAQGQFVTLDVVPNVVELPMRGGEQDVTVVLRNPTADTLRDVRLTVGVEAGVSVEPTKFESKEIVPRGEFAWIFKVHDGNAVLAPGQIRLRVDYVASPPPQASGQQGLSVEQPAMPRVMLRSVDVRVRSVETADTLADVQMETTLTTLNEKRPGIVYITTTNKSSIPVSVGKPVVSADDVIQTEVLDQKRQDSVKLAPRGSVVDAISIRTAEKVRPGKYLVLFKVPIRWDDAWGSQDSQVLVRQEVEVSVFGESQILTLMAIPTFFVLPGTIAMFTFLLVHRMVRKPRDPAKEYKAPITQSTPDFWLIAVTISLIVSVVYPFLTSRLLGRGVDYLESYSYADIVYLWLGSVVLTVGVFVLGLGLWNLIRQVCRLVTRLTSEARMALKNREAMKRTITMVDEPLEVLQKLRLKGLGVWLPRVVVGNDEAQRPVYAFVLEAWPPTDGSLDVGEYWVGPPIQLRWEEGADPKLRENVEKQLNPRGSMRELVRLLFEARRSQQVSLTWVPRSDLSGPVRLKGPLQRPAAGGQPQGLIVETPK